MTALLAELSIPLDVEYVTKAATVAGISPEDVVREMAQRIAFRLADEVRWKEGVNAADVRVVVKRDG